MCQCCWSGLLYLHGPDYKLMHISLQGNHLDNIDHILQCLLGLQDLREVILSQYDRDNPVCRLPGMAWKLLLGYTCNSWLDRHNWILKCLYTWWIHDLVSGRITSYLIITSLLNLGNMVSIYFHKLLAICCFNYGLILLIELARFVGLFACKHFF